MNKRDLKFFKELLDERRVELLREAGRSVDGMSDDKENFPDPTDRASLEFNRNFMLRIRDRERKLITKIDEALARIEDGSYGLCEECEEEIGVERRQMVGEQDQVEVAARHERLGRAPVADPDDLGRSRRRRQLGERTRRELAIRGTVVDDQDAEAHAERSPVIIDASTSTLEETAVLPNGRVKPLTAGRSP